MKLHTWVGLALAASASILIPDGHALWSQIGQDIDGEAASDQSGRPVAMNSDGTRVAIGAWYNDGNGENSGHVRIYDWIGAEWEQVGLDIDGEAEEDQFGSSIALSSDGSRIAIGARLNDGNGSDSGHVRVFDWDGYDWIQASVDIDGEAQGDRSGCAVALSADGNRLAIGADSNDGNGSYSGHVRVFDWNGIEWRQAGLDLDGEAPGDFSGSAVALSSDGHRLAIAARSNDGGGQFAGHVRVFDWNCTDWIQAGMDIDGEAAEDRSGNSIAFSSDGNRLAIGAASNDGSGYCSGHTRVFDWSDAEWIQVGFDIDGESSSDSSGWSVDLSSDGNRVAISAIHNCEGGHLRGHVRVYDWNGTAWIQAGADIDGEAESDYSGSSIALSSGGDRLVVGATFNDGNGYSSGHARVFSDRSATPTPTITPTPIPISINVEKALLGIPPIHPADPVTYAITITNTGPSEIIHLPLADIYDPAILTYLGAHPAGDDGIDDGRIDWTDLTVPFGDLEPGGSVTVDVLFELAATGSGLTVANLAEVAGAENQSGGQASGADDFRFVLDCTNLGIPQTGIGFDPPRATPGDLVSVRFQVRNDGQFPTTGGRVSVAYEGTPLEPSDDPNPHEIDSVMLDGIEPGAVEEHSVTWDTIGLSAVRIPLYFQLFDVLPAECTAEYNTTVVIYTVPVELVSWSAVAGDGEVILEWVTETEADLLGWRIFRSERYDGVYQRLNPALVPGHGTRFVRHRYEYVDEDVVNTGLYFYRLESIDLAGGTEQSSVVAASPGPGAAGAPTLRLMARRSRGVAGDALELRAAVEGGDVSREALVGIWLLLDGEVLGEVLPPTPVRIPASFSGEGLVWEHSLDGTEPPGTYELVGALLSPDSAGVISMSVASVHRWRR